MIHQRKILKAIAYAILLCFTSLTGAQPLYAIPANTQLPTGFTPITENAAQNTVNNTMTITQNGTTSVIKWDNFSIGADATVNFVGQGRNDFKDFNSFNYVNGGNVSEIYGQLNAIGGNIFIANPAGVQIGNSAQINVGSLYVTNKDVTGILDGINKDTKYDEIVTQLQGVNPASNAELMSLGSIISTNPEKSVTFDGGRIIIDAERLFADDTNTAKLDMSKLTVMTNDADDVVLGYDAYDEASKTFIKRENPFGVTVAKVENNQVTYENTNIDGYMWVRDLTQLQAIADGDLSGNYALRNSIDANYTRNEKYNENKGFKPIGTDGDGNAFTGRFDGLGNNIFGLTITRSDEGYVGLFGNVSGENAVIRNVTLNSGSITGKDHVGSIAGSVGGGARLEKITNTANVTGNENVGGVAGLFTGIRDTADASYNDLSNLVNIGAVSGFANVGGVVGKMENAALGGSVYNLGAVTGIDKENGDDKWSNAVGGIVGHASNVTIGDGSLAGEMGDDGLIIELGDEKNLIYNQLNIQGGYNVGGIAGLLEGDSSINYAANYGGILATGFTPDTYKYRNSANDTKEEDVRAANAGGIVGKAEGIVISNDDGSTEAGIEINTVENSGNVTTEYTTQEYDKTGDGKVSYEQYNAGNVGGVVGYANNTEITDAENYENLVAGAHNVGGVAGFLTGKSKVESAQNSGGEITATGARNGQDFVTERVSNPNNIDDDETFHIGNIGGIAGYLLGGDAKITNAANRGNVHSALIKEGTVGVPDEAKAANVGGIAGKVESEAAATLEKVKEQDESGIYTNATIANSYNTGAVQGYANVGGVAGQMFNGSVAGSHNQGNLSATRTASQTTSMEPLNLGGVVGDTTEMWTSDSDTTSGFGAVIYDVYNSGQVGDENYEFYGRHVGGVVGRLSGTLDRAFNTGEIYNGFSATGGLVGWWNYGYISNVFNTGNVTAMNKDQENGTSLVGGIVGSAHSQRVRELSYAYNLGTIRSFIPNTHLNSENENTGKKNINVVGGIVGGFILDSGGNNNAKISNVYTTGNIYAARQDANSDEYIMPTVAGGSTYQGEGEHYLYDSWKTTITGDNKSYDRISPIWNKGHLVAADKLTTEKAYYIKPEDEGVFIDIPESGALGNNNINNGYTSIEWNSRTTQTQYTGFTFKTVEDNNTYSDGWRYEEDNLPILNAYTPESAKDTSWQKSEIESVQYGTAANPLLTIVTLKDDAEGVALDWDKLNIFDIGSLAVYGGDLTLNNFHTDFGRNYNGTIFSAGDLTINASGAGEGRDGYTLGSGSRLFAQNVTFNAGTEDNLLDAAFFGDITSTNGDITIKGADVSVLGSLTSSKTGEEHKTTAVPGVAKKSSGGIDTANLEDPYKAASSVEEEYSTTAEATEGHGSISIIAGKVAEILFGTTNKGKIDTNGTFYVEGSDGVYIDSDLHFDGAGSNMKLKSGGEIVLDFSNMGKTSSGEGESDVEHMHNYFLDHFKTDGEITVEIAKDEDFIIGLDMWDEGTGGFDFTKYDVTSEGNHTLYSDIDDLNLTINADDKEEHEVRRHVFTWIESAEQLKGIQEAAQQTLANGESPLSFNYALKDDVSATGLTDYKPIASGDGETFTGVFDGRGFRIIGLDVGSDGGKIDNAGIFTKIGESGAVRDLRVYASDFYGSATAGAVAGIVESGATVDDVVTFGNRVQATGGASNVGGATGVEGAAGGVAGVNYGTINHIDASDLVAANGTNVTAGGLVGVNAGLLGEDFDTGTERPGDVTTSVVVTDSGVTTGSNGGGAHSLGGVVGVNTEDGKVTLADSMGTTSALYAPDTYNVDKNTGGIAGVNYGTMISLYNESIVTGSSNTGGVAGTNTGKMENAINATNVEGKNNTGGIVGENSGSITSGRNAGTVTGGENVGGIVGTNEEIDGEEDSGVLQKLSNAIAAIVTGVENVGGVAGSNSGTLKVENALLNEGAVVGKTSVGGIVGLNETGGEIQGTLAEGEAAVNTGSVTGETNVGGVAGTNKGAITGQSHGETAAVLSVSSGKITGNNNVGGVAGFNALNATIANANSDVTLTAIAVDTDGDEQLDDPENFGGVAGANEGTITNATNRGVITAYGAHNVGGIAGSNKAVEGDEESGLLENAGNMGVVIGGSHVGGVVGFNDSDKPEGWIENSGTVIATAGGAAGIIYENTRDLGKEGIELTLVNSGKVVGFATNKNHGTGGLIGVNSGTITNASLISTVKSAVTGGWNTGGLIGYNTGEITGGRADNETNGLGYYAYKIYNNGEVTGTQNVGGLIGNNAADGKLIAGYNTGRVTGVTADTSTFDINSITLPEDVKMPEGTELKDTKDGKGENVGGIAGTNAGILDQIFNFVMMKDKDDKVSGVSNTGGVVGSNEQGGELTNAYNATVVKATGNGGLKGNAVGLNEGTITNVYAANADGNLIGSSNGGTATNAYTFIADDTAQGAKVVSGDGQKQAVSYGGFNFDDTWKIYEGYGTPLLKVFLTEAKYGGETGIMQTGRPVGLPISGVTAGDGLEAYNANNSLLVALKNAGVGDGYLAFMSQQIALSDDGGTFNPNWLGYDIDATYDITPNPALLLVQNNGHLHWLHRGGERHRNFRERKAEIYFHEGGMIHE